MWPDTPHTRLEWLVIMQTLGAQKPGTGHSDVHSGALGWAFVARGQPQGGLEYKTQSALKALKQQPSLEGLLMASPPVHR